MPHSTSNPSVGRVGTPPPHVFVGACTAQHPGQGGYWGARSQRPPCASAEWGGGRLYSGDPPLCPRQAPRTWVGAPRKAGGPRCQHGPEHKAPSVLHPGHPPNLKPSSCLPTSPSPRHPTEEPPSPPSIGSAQPHGATPPAPLRGYPEVSPPAPLPSSGVGTPPGAPPDAAPPLGGVFWDGYF